VRAAETLDGSPVHVGRGSSTHISPDGRYALFSASSPEVVPDDTNEEPDVFVKDLLAGDTQRVSLAYDGSEGNGASDAAAVFSADNRRVIFSSGASNLVPGDTNSNSDTFVRDLRTGRVSRASAAADGTQSAGGLEYGPGFDASAPDVTWCSRAKRATSFPATPTDSGTCSSATSARQFRPVQPRGPYHPSPEGSRSARPRVATRARARARAGVRGDYALVGPPRPSTLRTTAAPAAAPPPPRAAERRCRSM
jgi:hypothetical protein